MRCPLDESAGRDTGRERSNASQAGRRGAMEHCYRRGGHIRLLLVR